MNTTIEFTEVMLLLIGVISAIIQGFKKFIDRYQTTTKPIAAIKPFLPIVSIALGVAGCYVTKQANPIVAGIVVGASAVFGYDFVKGLSPKVGVVLLLCVLTVSAGCIANPISMDPIMEAHVEMAAINCAEFNRRCQAGDPNACKMGLSLSNETLQYIVDGMKGEVVE